MRFDVVVVGGGIAGVSVAAELGADRSVLLLEREARLAHHASGRSAATFLESYGSLRIRALTRASRPGFDAMTAAGTPVLSPRRLLWVAAAENVAAVERLVAAEPVVRRIDLAEARFYCPALRPEWLAAAAVEDGAQDVDVAALFDHYRHRAVKAGVRIRIGDRLHSARRTPVGWRLQTEDGAVETPVIVNAAGAWVDDVAVAAGVAPLGFQPLRRTVAIVPTSMMDRDWPLVGEVNDGFYFRPESDALLVSPADETPSPPCDARPSTEDIAQALELVNEATTLGLRHVRTAWAGLRTFAPDRDPVVGYDPGVDGFFWLGGQGGYGMQTAPALARLAAALVRGEPAPAELAAEGLDPADLAPDRLR